jgi:hypothetical protein
MLRSILIAVPVLAATAAMLGIAVGERVLPAAFAAHRPMNSAEAAALGNASEVVRLLRHGEDPARVYPIRREIIGDSVQQATTLEAAMWARSVELIRLLDNERAIADDGTRQALACLAADLELPDVVDVLDDRPAGGGTNADHGGTCEPGAALKRVLDRTSR